MNEVPRNATRRPSLIVQHDLRTMQTHRKNWQRTYNIDQYAPRERPHRRPTGERRVQVPEFLVRKSEFTLYV